MSGLVVLFGLTLMSAVGEGQPRRRQRSAATPERVAAQLTAEEKWQEAAEKYQEALGARPRWAAGHVLHAYVLNRRLMGRPRRPVDGARSPAQSELSFLNDAFVALTSAENAVLLAPDDGDGHFVHGWILSTIGWDLAAAEEALQRASRLWQQAGPRVLEPRVTEPYWRSALADVRSRSTVPRTVDASRLLLVAARAALEQRKEDATAACARAAALAPGDDRVLVEVASRYWDLGEEASCLEVLEDGLARLPQSWRLHGAYGFFLGPTGRFSRSESHLRQALALPWPAQEAGPYFPGRVHCYWVLAMTACLRGDGPQAVSFFEQFVDTGLPGAHSDGKSSHQVATETIEAMKGSIDRAEALKEYASLAMTAAYGGQPDDALEACHDGLVWLQPDTIRAPARDLASLKAQLYWAQAAAYVEKERYAEAEQAAATWRRVTAEAWREPAGTTVASPTEERKRERWLAEVDAICTHAVVSEMVGRHAAAIEMLEQCIQSSPDGTGNHHSLSAYWNLARTAEEVAAVTAHARRAAGPKEARDLLPAFMSGLLTREEFLKAAQALLKPDDVDGRIGLMECYAVLATSYHRAGEEAEARRYWEQAIASGAGLFPTYWLSKWRLKQSE
ncbi:MAG: hypothetical protein HQ582_24125 [Planctomycetes bacterium]|nr:hypothetical protein [Planctomycetota bacterium]